jgi:DNA-binding transcriptional ArsR family regulator
MPQHGDPRLELLTELVDPTRFGILELLERGPMSATALAQQLGVSATVLANHLRRLREAELVAVEHEGRLSIYRLAEPGLREIFSMLNGLRGPPKPAGPTVPEAIACYDHVAGQVGVAVFDHLVVQGALAPREGEGELALGPGASAAFAALGVPPPPASLRRMPAYACLDSSLHRHHLGGWLGAELARSLKSRNWITAQQGSRRLTLTDEGRAGLAELGVEAG